MINKKRFPLQTLELLDEFSKMNYEFLSKSVLENNLIRFEDIDTNSDFFFEIKSQISSSGKESILYETKYKPKSELDTNETTENLGKGFVHKRFNNWIKIIKNYNKIDLASNDPIIEYYEEEFFDNFKIVDPDSETNPFNLEQQLALNEHLEYIIEIFESDSGVEAEEILERSKDLKQNLGKLTKTEAFKKLCRIWAMIRKKGIELLKTILKKGFNKLVELAITKGIDELLQLF